MLIRNIPFYFLGPPVYPDLSAMSLEDVDSVSEADRDTLAPLPPPAWNNQYPYSSASFLPHNLAYIPPHAYTSADSNSYVGSFVDGATPLPAPPSVTGGGGNGSAGSVHSTSGKSIHFSLLFQGSVLVWFFFIFLK